MRTRAGHCPSCGPGRLRERGRSRVARVLLAWSGACLQPAPRSPPYSDQLPAGLRKCVEGIRATKPPDPPAPSDGPSQGERPPSGAGPQGRVPAAPSVGGRPRASLPCPGVSPEPPGLRGTSARPPGDPYPPIGRRFRGRLLEREPRSTDPARGGPCCRCLPQCAGIIRPTPGPAFGIAPPAGHSCRSSSPDFPQPQALSGGTTTYGGSPLSAPEPRVPHLRHHAGHPCGSRRAGGHTEGPHPAISGQRLPGMWRDHGGPPAPGPCNGRDSGTTHHRRFPFPPGRSEALGPRGGKGGPWGLSLGIAAGEPSGRIPRRSCVVCPGAGGVGTRPFLPGLSLAVEPESPYGVV